MNESLIDTHGAGAQCSAPKDYPRGLVNKAV